MSLSSTTISILSSSTASDTSSASAPLPSSSTGTDTASTPIPPPASTSSSPSASQSIDTSSTLPAAPSSTQTSASSLPQTSAPLSITLASSSTSLDISTSGGKTVTSTSIVVTTPQGTISATGTSAPASSKSFFHNTGAVAGVFSVVGLIVLAIVIAVITNTIRRRRAKRFDREIAEAAAEAANVPPPVFLDDDDDQYGPGSGGRYGGGYGAGQYSDVSSHGTYGQPPMSVGHGQETYSMRELGPGPGEIYDPHGYSVAGGAAAGAGAAGIGVARARSTRDPGGYASGLQEGSSPYPAFATPGGMQQQHPAPGGGAGGFRGPGSPEHDPLEASGMGAGAAAMQRGISLHHQPQHNQQQQQPDYANVSRSLSHRNGSGEGYYSGPTSAEYVSPQSESYASHYQAGPITSLAHSSRSPIPVAGEMDAAYGGYMADHHIASGGAAAVGVHDNPSHRDEYGDDTSGDEDDRPTRRVLKVANE